MRALLPLVVLVFGFSWPGLADAQWKWRDAGGRINISDTPPPRSVPDQDILQRPAAPPSRTPAATSPAGEPPAAEAAEGAASAPAEPKLGVDPELEARRRAQEQEQQARQRQEEQRLALQRAENCERARSSLRQLESGMRMARVNEKGERIVIDDKERALEMQRARQVIASECR